MISEGADSKTEGADYTIPPPGPPKNVSNPVSID